MIGPGPSASGGGGGPRDDDRTPVMSSQLALRVAIVGSVALLMFAVIFLRLWFLQVLTGDAAVVHARGNITRRVPVAAPRGAILASDGKTALVESVKVPAILIQPQQLPAPLVATEAGMIHQPVADNVVYTRLERALGMPTRATSCKFSITYENTADKLVAGTFTPKLAEVPCIIAQHNADILDGSITIATNVDVAEQAYISERQTQFTGVQVSQVAISKYPEGTLAAQLLGTVGSNSVAGTTKRLFTDVKPYDNVGQDGLEYQYNKYLQGKDGYQRIEVNAQGTYEGEGTPVESTTGYNLKTSINLNLEKVGTESLAHSIQENGGNDGGAFVAMNPQNGQVYGMGSLPSYDPQELESPDLSQKKYDQLFADNPEDPLFNRADQAVGPDGSTFKIITATAALESGEWTPDKLYDDTGEVCPTPDDPASCMHNAPGEGGAGPIDLENAIEISDDDFFYNLGGILNVQNPLKEPQGGALQEWAKKFGIGQTPHIDLPYASAGTRPTPGYVAAKIQEETECDAGTGFFSYTNGDGGFSTTPKHGYHKTPKRAAGYCGIAELPNAGWTVGDNMHMAIGQGDVQASPLQVAMAYSAIENGGTLVTPHIGEDIQNAEGQVVQKIDPGPERKLHVNPTYLQTIQTGLRLAASGPTGTSTDVMKSFPLPVYGKTGTADYEPTSGPDAGVDTVYAWYSAYVPASATSKPIEVVVWVEDGGYGDVAAAPVARQILSQWFYGKPGIYATGTSTDQ